MKSSSKIKMFKGYNYHNFSVFLKVEVCFIPSLVLILYMIITNTFCQLLWFYFSTLTKYLMFYTHQKTYIN